jgi:hypothetical protein
MADNKAPLLAYLTAEGYVPNADEQGGIAFKREGRMYLSFVGEDDPNYFNVYCYMSYGELVPNRETALAAANEVNRSLKAIKITLPDDNDPSKISFGIEVLLPTPESFQPIFERSLAVIGLSIDHFSAKISSARPFRPETPAA